MNFRDSDPEKYQKMIEDAHTRLVDMVQDNLSGVMAHEIGDDQKLIESLDPNGVTYQQWLQAEYGEDDDNTIKLFEAHGNLTNRYVLQIAVDLVRDLIDISSVIII